MGTKKRTPIAAKPTRVHSTPVLLMAYGSARTDTEEGVRAYLDDVLGHYRGETATDAEVADLKARYESIGGSPLYDVTGRVARALQNALDRGQEVFDVRVAMRHSPPFIEDAVHAASKTGAKSGIAVALAPFGSRLTNEAYYKEVEKASEGRDLTWWYANDWNLHPQFLTLWERLIKQALDETDATDTVVVFTNHSLPARILNWNDPYPTQFSATAGELADRLSLDRWSLAFQSAGKGNQPWLGPSLFEVIGEWISQGAKDFVIAPIGFLVDHLEVRFDIDVDAAKMAKELGVSLRRTEMPNDADEMIEMLVDLVRTTVGGRG
ncbi:MAG: ferrochelatase [Gemmatimonadales bacterium]